MKDKFVVLSADAEASHKPIWCEGMKKAREIAERKAREERGSFHVLQLSSTVRATTTYEWDER